MYCFTFNLEHPFCLIEYDLVYNFNLNHLSQANLRCQNDHSLIWFKLFDTNLDRKRHILITFGSTKHGSLHVMVEYCLRNLSVKNGKIQTINKFYWDYEQFSKCVLFHLISSSKIDWKHSANPNEMHEEWVSSSSYDTYPLAFIKI